MFFREASLESNLTGRFLPDVQKRVSLLCTGYLGSSDIELVNSKFELLEMGESYDNFDAQLFEE